MIALASSLDGLRRHRTHTWAMLYEVTRTDGEVHRYTNHDQPIPFGGETFTPIGAPESESSRQRAGMTPGTTSVRGFSEVPSLPIDDLRKELYRESVWRLFEVDWRFPFLGAFRSARYVAGDVDFDGETVGVQLRSTLDLLDVTRGRLFSRRCDYILGDPVTCKASLAGVSPAATGSLAHTSGTATVTAVTGFTNSDKRLRFRTDLVVLEPSWPDKWFRFGKLTWITGNNVIPGREWEVRTHLQANGEIGLFQQLPEDIEVGDTFTVTAGCDWRRKTCQEKFGTGSKGNVENFGGAGRYMPGRDKIDNPKKKKD
ncbi:MAG: DUF2163 domain-containing protein [Planctomycetota bacterium JB042]